MKKEVKKDSSIKAVIFDIGGVLFLGDKKVKYGHQNINVHEYLSKKFNLSLKNWFELIEKDYEKAITGEQSKNKILNSLSKKLNTSSEKLEKLFIKAHKKYFRKNKGLFNLARKLQNKGYLIGILSDQTHFSYDALVKRNGFDFFDSVVISCEEGMRKPNKKFYRLPKKQLENIKKISYREMVFIDNRKWNLKPSKELGMKTIHYKNNKQIIEELNKLLGKQSV
jgi:epoxide hydrolase-like predicted phosphatase